MKKKIKLIFVITSIMLISFSTSASPSFSYELETVEPMATEYQIYQCMKDRYATEEFLDMIPFVYEYSQEVGIDPTIVMAISSLETGYGKSNLFKSYNNPGGIKAVRGWRKFKTLKNGYKYMIDLLGTYAGLRGESSYLYGKAKTTQELGKYYWVENGCDYGYHNKVAIMVNSMLKYPKLKTNDKTNSIKEDKKEKINPLKEYVKKSKETSLDKIYRILDRKKKHEGSFILRYILQKDK